MAGSTAGPISLANVFQQPSITVKDVLTNILHLAKSSVQYNNNPSSYQRALLHNSFVFEYAGCGILAMRYQKMTSNFTSVLQNLFSV